MAFAVVILYSLFADACGSFFFNLTLDFSKKELAISILDDPNWDPGLVQEIKLANGETIALGEKLGEGHFSVVRKIKNRELAIKIPKSRKDLYSFKKELEAMALLQEAGIPIADILETSDASEPIYLIKPLIRLKKAAFFIENGQGLSGTQIEALAKLFIKAYISNLVLDVNNADNFVWDPERKEWILLDLYLLNHQKSPMSRLMINSIDAWKNTFLKTDEEKQMFTRAIAAQIGEEGLKEIMHAIHRNREIMHAIRHDPTAPENLFKRIKLTFF